MLKRRTRLGSLLLFFALSNKSHTGTRTIEKMRTGKGGRWRSVALTGHVPVTGLLALALPTVTARKQASKQAKSIFQLPLEPGVDKYQGPGYNKEDEVPGECTPESNLSGASLLAPLLSGFFPPGRHVFFQRFSRHLETLNQGAWGQRPRHQRERTGKKGSPPPWASVTALDSSLIKFSFHKTSKTHEFQLLSTAEHIPNDTYI